ncbi:MAG: hypothetical protein K0S09_1449 [Sphingobacteriaceae bacterium]|jgi:hypothetical protein|nr:hypothetical protein [Sphingobacteriaceae bacterium]
MKTLLLTAAAFLTLTFSSKADDRNKNNTSAGTTIASKIMGSPDEQAPEELAHLLAKPATVAPAPLVIGNANDEAPVELRDIPAHPVQVPVAPLVIGNADEEAPLELGSMLAHI